MSGAFLVSLVVPAYREEGNLDRLHAAVVAALAPCPIAWEMLIVDDGSDDGTWDRVCALRDTDSRVRGIRLSRNFGHQYALLAGLTHARGDAVVCLDADLQHPPAIIPTLLEHWLRGYQIVHTVRHDTMQASWFKRRTSRVYYEVFSFLSGVSLSPGMADFRLLDRQVVNELLTFQESHLFLRGLVEWVGYRSIKVPYEPAERYAGESKYTLRRMLRLAWIGITSFSVVPLRAGIVIGLLTGLFAFLMLTYAVYAKLFMAEVVVPGWATIVALVSLLFGVLFVLVGLLGEYLARILEQVRQRPRFLVSEFIGADTMLSAHRSGAPMQRLSELNLSQLQSERLDRPRPRPVDDPVSAG